MSGSKSSDVSSSLQGLRTPEASKQRPLGLTVHSLPEVGDAVASGPAVRKGRLKMLSVLLMCAAPVIASYFTYYVIRPDGRQNFGELIDPQRPVPSIAGQYLDGRKVELSALKGQWLLVSVGGGACKAACPDHLYLQRQIRESLGREKDRVDWVWLVNDAATVPAEIEPAARQATTLRVDGAALSEWLQPAVGHKLEEHLYLIDPMGNWMLRYPAGMGAQSAAKAKRDLERVLRASSSWDTAGRAEQL